MTTQSSIVTQLQELSQFITAKMTVSKVIEWKKEFSDLLPGITRDDTIRKVFFDDALLMTVEANINAGIDFSKITTGSVVVVKDQSSSNAYVVELYLPKAEVFDVYLTEKTKPFERKIWILSKWNQELETKMRNDAVRAVSQEAIDANIIDTAQQNAKKTITDLLKKTWIEVRSIIFQ